MRTSYIPAPEWFNINSYSLVCPPQLARPPDLEVWRTQIITRSYLGLLLEAIKSTNSESDKETYLRNFDEEFNKLKRSPLIPTGSRPDYSVTYPSNNSVFSLPYGIAEALVATLAQHRPVHKEGCDEQLLKKGVEAFEIQRHVVVDLTAAKSDIIKDFNAWLNPTIAAYRQRKQKHKNSTYASLTEIQSWVNFYVLPYQDLFLYYCRENTPLPSATVLANWLFTESEGDKDTVLKTAKKAKVVFTLDTLRHLNLAINRQAS